MIPFLTIAKASNALMEPESFHNVLPALRQTYNMYVFIQFRDNLSSMGDESNFVFLMHDQNE